MAPMEEVSTKFPSCSQGGGVYIYDATATFTDCEIYSNTAGYVRARAPCPIPWPPWKKVPRTDPVPV